MAEDHAAFRPPHSGLPVFSIADCRCSATKCSGNIRPALQVGVPVDGLQPPLQAVLHTAYASHGSAGGAAPQGGDEGRLSPGGGPPRSPLRQKGGKADDDITWFGNLPDGLSFEAGGKAQGGGRIIGTPNAVTPAGGSLCEIFARNKHGTVSYNWHVEITDMPPIWDGYGQDPAVYEEDRPISINVAYIRDQFWPAHATGNESNRVGRVACFSCSGLPEGLHCDPRTGSISGTPCTVQAPTSVTIVAKGGEWFDDDKDEEEEDEGNRAGAGARSGALSLNGARRERVPHYAHEVPYTLTITVTRTAAVWIGYSHDRAVYSKGAPIAPNHPRLQASRAPDRFELGEGVTLPPGLVLDMYSGVISGTPTDLPPGAPSFQSYTIVAVVEVQGEQQRAETVVDIRVVDIPPLLMAYTEMHPRYQCGIPISPNRPAYSDHGGVPLRFATKGKALPDGLTLCPRTGVIEGTPKLTSDTEEEEALTHTVVASNSGGESSISIVIAVIDANPHIRAYQRRAGAGGSVAYVDLPTTTKQGRETLPDGMVVTSDQELVALLPLYDVRSDAAKGIDHKGMRSEVVPALRGMDPHRPGESYSPDVLGVSRLHGLRFSVVEGSLPHGVTLDALSGVVSGVPRREAYSGASTCEAKIVASTASGYSQGVWLRTYVLADDQGESLAKQLAPPELTEPEYYKVIVLGDSQTGKTSLLATFQQHHELRYQADAQTRQTPQALRTRRRSTFRAIAGSEGDERIGNATPNPTLHPEFIKVSLSHPDGSGRKLHVQLWDTVGQEKYGGLNVASAHFRRADGVLLVFDVSRRSTFVNLEQWLHDLDSKGGSSVDGFDRTPTMLVMNKVDLLGRHGRRSQNARVEQVREGLPPAGQNMVQHSEIESFRAKHGLSMFAKTSAKFDDEVQTFGGSSHMPPNHAVHAAITMLCHRAYMRKHGMDFVHPRAAMPQAMPQRSPHGLRLTDERPTGRKQGRCCSSG